MTCSAPPTIVLAALSFALIHKVEGVNDFYDRILPRMMARLEEVGQILLPLPEDQVREATQKVGSLYIPVDSETEPCKNHSDVVFDSFLKNEIWALKMVDASSKLPSGIMDGYLMDMGAYDQCLSVVVPGDLFRGQHCIIETKGILPIMEHFNPEQTFLPTMRTDIAISVCVPSSCTPEDIKTHMDVVLSSANASAIVTKYSCSSTLPEPFSFMEWVTILFLVLIGALVILGTVHDSRTFSDSEKSPLLTAWSLSSNIPRMLDTNVPPVALPCLNGLRVFAMTWIIGGHRLLFMLAFPNSSFKKAIEGINEVSFAWFESTQVAVEIFFLMSGTLLTYSYLRYRQKTKTFNVVHFYVSRYLRLTPAFAVMVLFYSTLLIRAADGPMWRRNTGYFIEYCQKNWWTNLLYLQNYIHPYELCISQSWYLASDFQLYLFSPVLLIPLYKKPKLGLALTAGFFVLTTVGGLYNAFAEELKAGGAVTYDRRTEINQVKDYIVTHIRAASFLMGVAFGYLLFQFKQGMISIKLSRPQLLAGWLLSIFMILFSVFFVLWFQTPDYVYNPVVDTTYQVLHRHMFSLGIAWIILVCTLGHGGFVEKFLSWSVFVPLARLTYCAYLTHVMMQNIHNSSQRTYNHISILNLIHLLCADLLASYLSGAVLYLTVEAPFAKLTDSLFQAKKKENPKSVPENLENSNQRTVSESTS